MAPALGWAAHINLPSNRQVPRSSPDESACIRFLRREPVVTRRTAHRMQEAGKKLRQFVAKSPQHAADTAEHAASRTPSSFEIVNDTLYSLGLTPA